jgi:hypothetical protein
MREIAHQIITTQVIAEKAAKFSVILGRKTATLLSNEAH